jgi:hypothetical protein
MRGPPAFRPTLRAGVIEKRCKITAFGGDAQIFTQKSDKFLQSEQLSLQKERQICLILIVFLHFLSKSLHISKNSSNFVAFFMNKVHE